MTTIEALIIRQKGWNINDALSSNLHKKACEVIENEYDRIYLEAQKNQLQRELNEIEEKLKKSKLPF